MNSHPLFEKLRIFAPGPTPVPQEVLAELARAPLHHRTKEFTKILEEVKDGLRFIFQTTETPYLLSASGTGGMETAVVNLFSREEEVLVINGGKFGERWAKICQAHGLRVHTLKVEWGLAVNPDDVKKALANSPKTRAVLFQASETSTGVYHPVEELTRCIHAESDALVIVDAITALGVSHLPMDEWDLDVVVTGSQKALMLPPGLSFLALSKRAQDQRKRTGGLPRFYFDLNAEDKALAVGETAWTPSVSLVSALNVVLKRMKAVGLEKVFDHHIRLAEATRLGLTGLGLKLFAKGTPSNALTAAHVPEGISDGKKIISILRDQYGITVAGGQDQWKGKIFRVAHLGFYDTLDVLTLMSALGLTLRKLGFRCDYGSGVEAAASFLHESDK